VRAHSLLAVAALSALPLAAQTPAPASRPATPTVAQARRFLARAESTLNALTIRAARADWVANTYITFDTEELTAQAAEALGVATQRLASEARAFERVTLPSDLRRKLVLLRLLLAAPPPANALEAAELSRLASGLNADYGRGTYCRLKPGTSEQQCRQLPELEDVLRTSTDPAELADAWQGWHRVGAPMRERYTRFVTLANKGARGMGFTDAGAMWRASYDMPAADFQREVDRLWEQLKPLYLQLHAFVRARLAEKYGPSVVRPDGMIPAHLFGNMWAQEWGHIYDVVAPPGVPPSIDVGALLTAKQVDALGMVRYGERFYTSLGFTALPETFWQRSQFTKPRDREVVCHASAWDLDNKDDLRIKMCIRVNGEDFVTIHHELGHNFYQRAYAAQPYLFQNGANDGFHEAVGDAVALSITPEYLKQVGLLETLPSAASDTAALLRVALDKIAFLPFAVALDRWRWGVFAGEITPDRYNAAWWDLKHRYQGVVEPLPRSEADFDPGAKYHVPGNVPYIRYFIARILQFQFHRSWCRAAGWTGPLYRCSVYGNAAAGEQVRRMLEAGASKPWQETLFAATGERQMDATAMVDYFQPLLVWLERQNQGKPIGWGTARTDAAPPAGAPAPAAPAPTPAPAPTLTPTPAPAPPATGSPFRVDPTLATRGKTVWSKNGCGGCHGIGKKMAGPDLANIAARRSREWLHRWMKNTKQMLESDSIGRALLAEWKGMRMPQFNLSDADIDALLHHITQESEKAGVQR
jgi:peptidyl-dipeptidase A